MKEFSKLMVMSIGIIWVLAALYGGWYTVHCGTGFAELLAFIGAPMTAAVLPMAARLMPDAIALEMIRIFRVRTSERRSDLLKTLNCRMPSRVMPSPPAA